MCWTLVDYMMINALLKGLYEEWSCEELSSLQVWLGIEDWVNNHVYPPKPSYISREEDEVQVQ